MYQLRYVLSFPPNLEVLRPQKNREADAIKAIENHISRRRKLLQNTTIYSAQSFHYYPGQVFVRAYGSDELTNLAATLTYMFHNRIAPIEHEEWIRLYSAIDNAFDIEAPSWIRIKRDLYKGDLALLERSYSTGFVDVLVVPRIRRRGHKKPKPSLLPIQDALIQYGAKMLKKDPVEPQWFTVRKMQFKHGLQSIYLEHSKITSTLPKDLREIVAFVESTSAHGLSKYADFIHCTVCNITEGDLLTTFHINDRVRISSGPFITMSGKVKEVTEHSATILLPSDTDTSISQEVSVVLSDLRRVFEIGDHIRVRQGREMGRHGIVVTVDGPILIFTESTAKDNVEVDPKAKTNSVVHEDVRQFLILIESTYQFQLHHRFMFILVTSISQILTANGTRIHSHLPMKSPSIFQLPSASVLK